MPRILEIHREDFTISTDPARLNLEAIAEMLSRAYWVHKRTTEMIARSLQNSLTFGIYVGSGQIGLARVVSDYVTFAWLCDVFIHEDYRGRGLGKWLMEAVHSHQDLREVRRWMLATRDAHGLYGQYGWIALENPEKWMVKTHG